MKALRIDLKAQKRVGVARDCLAGMSKVQLASMTSARLQGSFGLLPTEADYLLAAFCRS